MNLMMSIGKSGVKGFQNQVNTSAQNIANSTTTGFKKQYAELQELIYYTKSNMLPSESSTSANIMQGVGVRADVIKENNRQGALTQTGVDTHYAVSGNGYFAVVDSNTQEIYLTRDGSFSLNEEGTLVDTNGNEVILKTTTDEAGNTIQVPALHLPTQPAFLTKLGDNYYSVNPQNLVSNLETNEGFGQINSGYLEASNVDLGEEMTNLMIAQRAYSMNMKIIQTADETREIVNNLR